MYCKVLGPQNLTKTYTPKIREICYIIFIKWNFKNPTNVFFSYYFTTKIKRKHQL